MWRKVAQESVTLFVAAVLAGLVWLYAESAKVRQEELTVQVEFVAPESTPLVIGDPQAPDRPPPPLAVKVMFRGATGQVQAARKLMEGPFRCEVRADHDRPDQSIDLRQLLASDARVAALGIQIGEVRPETARVWVEPIVPVRMTVRPEAADVELEQLEAEPKEVVAALPASAAARLGAGAGLKVVLDAAVVGSAREGERQVREVPLTLPPELDSRHASLTPDRVRLVFTVRSQTHRIETVLLRLLLPAEERAQQFLVKVAAANLTVGAIEVKGPRARIEDIKSGLDRVEAILRVGRDEMEQLTKGGTVSGAASKRVEWRTPPGVEVVTAAPSVPFTVEPRPAAAPPPVAPPP